MERIQLHMTTSSKRKAEKHRLHHYVTITILNMSSKGTTEQFVLHSNEQLRQLDEVSPPNEILPYPTSLTLLQTAVNAILELRVVETWSNSLTCPPTPLIPPWTIMVTVSFCKMPALCMIKDTRAPFLLPPGLSTNMILTEVDNLQGVLPTGGEGETMVTP